LKYQSKLSGVIKDTAIVAISLEGEQEAVGLPRLSSGTIFNDLNDPYNPDFKVTPLSDSEYIRNSTR